METEAVILLRITLKLPPAGYVEPSTNMSLARELMNLQPKRTRADSYLLHSVLVLSGPKDMLKTVRKQWTSRNENSKRPKDESGRQPNKPARPPKKPRLRPAYRQTLPRNRTGANSRRRMPSTTRTQTVAPGIAARSS